MLNRTEWLQIESHRNDRWQNRAEGGFTTASSQAIHSRRHGKPVIVRRSVSAEDIGIAERLKGKLDLDKA